MSELVDINGLEKARVLAVLYNAAAPKGMGFLQTEAAPEVMSVQDASAVIEGRGHDHMKMVRAFLPFVPGPYLSFTYVYGRPIMADISGDSMNATGFDQNYGRGAAAHAIAELRATGSVSPETVYAVHVRRLQEAVHEVLVSPDDYTKLQRDVGLGDHTARLVALARRALGASA